MATVTLTANATDRDVVLVSAIKRSVKLGRSVPLETEDRYYDVATLSAMSTGDFFDEGDRCIGTTEDGDQWSIRLVTAEDIDTAFSPE